MDSEGQARREKQKRRDPQSGVDQLMTKRGEQPWRTNRARVLRANATSSEQRLWACLRDRRLNGLKFVRQAPIGGYFVDFLCRERMLAVEVDGATHGDDGEQAADARRDRDLASLGYRVIRVTNEDVRENIDGVLEAIVAHAEGRQR